ncbi:hypothetical protein D918_01810 [Trichuris suis]|nr:hypothetical protein D918_01810 [Trichuris suis]
MNDLFVAFSAFASARRAYKRPIVSSKTNNAARQRETAGISPLQESDCGGVVQANTFSLCKRVGFFAALSW